MTASAEAPIEHVIAWGDDFETWAQRWPATGSATGLPLLVLHGGPGSTHDYLRELRHLRRSGRDVVFYDQLGNGRSTHLRHRLGDESFWTPELFVTELDRVVEHFGLARSGYHLLGQSWGGMLAIEWALEHRPGLASVVLANAPSSMATWARETQRLRALLPPEVRAALDAHEADGTLEDPEYVAATNAFYRRHFCRLDPWPEDFQRSFDLCDEDPTVYLTMVGPTEFTITGSLASWDRDDDLDRFTVPALILNGEHDEATDAVVEAARRLIPSSTYVKIAGASHSPHLEAPEGTFAAIEDFLSRHDTDR